jgi:hypothetical protein
MKSTLNRLLPVVLAIGAVQVAAAQAPAQQRDVISSIATLFARDPLMQSLCFKDGGPGGVFQNGQLRNRCSDLNFNSYSANALSVGVEGGRQGTILDLGTPEELKSKYGYSETVSGGQGFASIDVQNGKALILKDHRTGALQELAESADLFRAPRPVASVPVKLGHVYLMRMTDTNDRAFEMFAKVLVLAHAPNESVTVRWNLLSINETTRR